MDTKSFTAKPEPIVDGGKPSRLPAGSTLEVNGIHVPHPHAEVNLAGAGDPRLGDTKAVTEGVVVHSETKELTVETRPLDESVKPKVVTLNRDTVLVDKQPHIYGLDQTSPEAAKPSEDLKVAIEEPTLHKVD